ncbi:MAG: formylglycine-generating enzyme family protein [Flexilinea sp.]
MFNSENEFPKTNASAITSPPSNMDGINDQIALYGTGADPNTITLVPTNGGRPGWQPYAGKNSMEFEVPYQTPILAPMDIEFIGYKNENFEQIPGKSGPGIDDLDLCFKSVDKDWPGLIFCLYHLYTSPLLSDHNVVPECEKIEGEGWIYYLQKEFYIRPTNKSCKALLGKKINRGELIAYAGKVEEHSQAPVRFKVPFNKENPTVEEGFDKFLHWVQPGSFFYWKCFNPDGTFPDGVLAYPFECDGYQLPVEQRDVNFKYDVPEEDEEDTANNKTNKKEEESNIKYKKVDPKELSDLEIGSYQISEKDEMTLLYVPRGNFQMGYSDSQYAEAMEGSKRAGCTTKEDCEFWYKSAKPMHTVWVDAFWIDKTEVTNEMYAKCVADGVCDPPKKMGYLYIEKYYNGSKYKDYPVNFVDWSMANTYCNWAGRSLPTEAQWEKAARGTDGRTFPWGEGIDCQKANYLRDNLSLDFCVGITTQVGSYPENISPYGAMDMAGNGIEWVTDWWAENYYNSSPDRNPIGPEPVDQKVLRGGSFCSYDVTASNIFRFRQPPKANDGIGFRCALSVPSSDLQITQSTPEVQK